MTEIAIVSPKMTVDGGADAVTLWTIESLSDSYNVTLITFEIDRLQKLNSAYGTDLSSSDFTIRKLLFPSFLEEKCRFGLLKKHLLMRHVKSVNGEYDVLFSTWNEMDFGREGIQYIHFPTQAQSQIEEFLGEKRIIGERKWYHEDIKVRDLYTVFCHKLSGYEKNRMRQNKTVVCSKWVGEAISDIYNITSTVVYPPVNIDSKTIPWEEQENGFVIVGRISEEKRVYWMLQLLQEVRKNGYDIHVHVAGGVPETKYGKEVTDLSDKLGDWVQLEGRLEREELADLMSTHRYGLHAMKKEPSGVVIPELVSCNCIPFVPDSGGPPELVDSIDEIVFSNSIDAKKKIITLLESPQEQKRVREELFVDETKNDASEFTKHIRNIVEDFLSEKGRE